MSFVLNLTRFLRVAVQDPGGARIAGFDVAPTARTRAVLARYELVWRPEPGGLALFSQSNPEAASPLLSPIDRLIRLSFAVRMRDRRRAGRYGPPGDTGGRLILLDNLGAAGAVETGGALHPGAVASTADLVTLGDPRRFPVTLDLTGGTPATIEWRDRFTGAVLGSAPIALPDNAGPATAISVDLGTPPMPPMRLVTPAPGTLDLAIYADAALAARPPDAVIELWWATAQDTVPAGTGAVFTATFDSP